MHNLTIFASGGGSNALKIIEKFKHDPTVNISRIVSNNPKAGVLNHGEKHGIDITIISKKDFKDPDNLISILKGDGTTWVILAGFIWLIPPVLIQAFQGRIINLHPALLPKFGGKGMFGHHVHDAVSKANEKETGITIHKVNENYDEGSIIFQSSFRLTPKDNPKTIEQNIHKLEHEHFPEVIGLLLKYFS
jgi:phosphoribosylglycinamide formyltransferase-1